MGVTSDLEKIEAEMKSLALQARLELTEKEGKFNPDWQNYTSGHLIRTAEYAEGIAKVLKLDDETTKLIWLGCNLHDAGKIYVGNDLILSNKKFSEAEKTEIRKHPEYGIKWLEKNTDISRVPKEIINIILHHHEDWNDNGYPSGLKMGHTPYVARLARVADSWDAITADRPYMKAMKREDAAKDMEKRSGIKYEPTIVNALLVSVGMR